MTIVGLDCAGKVAGVCVMRDGEVLFNNALDEGLTHSQTLLPLFEEACQKTGIVPGDIDLYGITSGPGSFTGLRIGLSMVKGLSLPFGTPVVGVSTLEALARGCGIKGSIVGALNARRGEVYWAAFANGEAGFTRLTPDAANPATTLETTLEHLPGPIHLVGDGAGICYTEFEGKLPVVVAEGMGLATAALGAAQVAGLAYGTGKAKPAADVRPEYLRLAQAERERAARLQKAER